MVSLTNLLCIFSFWSTFLTIQAGLLEIDFNEKVQPYNTYYTNCSTPVTCNENSKYRTINGSCNNLQNPLWGSTGTPYLRLAPANYADGVYIIRNQVDGTKLPGPRELQLELFLFRSRDIPANYNYHVNQLGQWIAHDIAFTPPDLTGPSKCCDVQTDENIPTQCQTIIEIPSHDPVYSKIGQTCMEFRRVETATNNFNCTVTPQIAMNQAPSFIDASQLYGRTTDLANEIRTFMNGKLVTDIINGNEFCPLFKRNGSLLCTGRDNVAVCFSGDIQKRGIVKRIYQTWILKLG